MAIVAHRGLNATNLLLALGLLIGALLRILDLNAQSFWYDEAFSWDTSTRSFSEMIAALVADFVHPPLHYFFLHGWLELWDGAAAARAFAALFGIATLPAIYWLGCELYDRRTAATAVLLLALSQLGIAYSQEVRPYSQLMFFTLTTTAFYVRAVEQRNLTAWLGATISAILALGTHYYAVFVIGGIALWHLFYARARLPLWWIGLALVLGIAACLPWLLSGVIGAALNSPVTIRSQPSWFSVNWGTPFETLAAFGNARLQSVISPSISSWALILTSALFIAPVLMMMRPPWIGSFLSIGFVMAFGLLSGFGKWAVLLSFLVAGLHGVDILRNSRLHRLAMAMFLSVVLVVSVVAELRGAPVFVFFVLGILLAAPLGAWLPKAGSPHNASNREVLLAVLVGIPVVALLLAGMRGVQYDVRYTLAALPPFYLLVARALTLLTSPLLRRFWLAAIIAFSILGIRTYLEVPTKENYRDSLAFLHERYQSGDCVAFVPFWRIPIQWRLYGYSDIELRPLSESELKDGAATCRHVWLVLYERVTSTAERGKAAEAALAERRNLVEIQKFHWVRLAHFGEAKKLARYQP